MRKSRTISLAIFLVIAFSIHAQENPPFRLLHTTPLPGIEGDLEHLAVDLAGNRLFLGAEDHKSVEVFDLRTGEHLRSITGFGSAPHALRYLPSSNKLVVTVGDDTKVGMVQVVSGADYKIVNTIKLGPGVDCALYDPESKYYYVASGLDEPSQKSLAQQQGKTSSLNIIDTETFKVIGGEIKLPGTHSEAMAIDHSAKKLYVNLTRMNEVGVVDLEKGQLIARWPLPDTESPISMAIDEPNHRLFISTRKPPKFIVYDTDTGKVIATFPCVPTSDEMTFDRVRKRIYITGDGFASVFQQRDADHYEHVAEFPTAYRTKTHVFVPELNRFYVAGSAKFKPGAVMSLLIFQVEP
jgi:WD40 repeat protein